MELCACTLDSFITKGESYTGPSPGTKIEALIQVTEGLRYLHGRKIIHRDIKPVNILIAFPANDGEKAKVKLADFGLSKPITRANGEEATFTGQMGTESWAAPELHPVNIKIGESFTNAVDIFSLGCVYAYCLTGHHPFGNDGSTRIRNIKDGRIEWTNQNDLGDESLKNLIKKMIAHNPKHRPSLKLDANEAPPSGSLADFYEPPNLILDISSDDYKALRATIMGTVGGEVQSVQRGLAWLIKNRAEDVHMGWPHTVAGVCRARNQFVVLTDEEVEMQEQIKDIIDEWLPGVYGDEDPTGGAHYCYAFKGTDKEPQPAYLKKAEHTCDIEHMRFYRARRTR